MQKLCNFCDEPLRDGEDVGFVAHGAFRNIPSKIAYAISKDFTVDELYHRECLRYVLGEGGTRA